MENIIIPNCLRVDNAIIFLRSCSKIATTPDINMVIIEINNNSAEQVSPKIKEKRINRYTPAVTKVEECTKAETGVGAAIAAGNQAEKGI
jgi:hypothetical protein